VSKNIKALRTIHLKFQQNNLYHYNIIILLFFFIKISTLITDKKWCCVWWCCVPILTIVLILVRTTYGKFILYFQTFILTNNNLSYKKKDLKENKLKKVNNYWYIKIKQNKPKYFESYGMSSKIVNSKKNTLSKILRLRCLQ